MRRTVLSLLVAGAFGVLPARASACKTLVVRAGSSIQAAVDRAAPCEWVPIAPGVYHERVWIRTPHLHLRGLDRNRSSCRSAEPGTPWTPLGATDAFWPKSPPVNAMSTREPEIRLRSKRFP